MKIGDMIKYINETGLVLDVRDDGITSGQVLVLWQDGKPQWVACVMCEVISESR
jgi:hypothetical protein